MNTQWMATILAAALCATAAMAQQVKATIPFDFSVAQGQMPAGTYSVSRLPGTGNSFVMVLRNVTTGKSAVSISQVELDRNEAKGLIGKLVFACTSGRCSLAELHTPINSKGRKFATPPPKAGEQERRVAVVITRQPGSSGF